MIDALLTRASTLKDELDSTKLMYNPGNGLPKKEFTMRNDV